jgi:NAD(P)-dependent dehydrogenase (short-subunit alcohol dehydrogenase family)
VAREQGEGPVTRELDGRRVVLTGVSRGVGYETAKRFLSAGARVLGVGVDPARLARATESLRPLGDFVSLAVDLRGREAGACVARAVDERWGALDLLVNNAAIMVHGDDSRGFEGEPPEALEQTLDANVTAPFRLTHALLPLLRKGSEPRIVNVGSGAGTAEGIRESGIASYRLSKWALHGMTLMLAAQLKGEVAVNAFDPGWVKTDMGGPNAPGSPVDSAEGALAVACLPFHVAGKFWKDGREIPF